MKNNKVYNHMKYKDIYFIGIIRKIILGLNCEPLETKEYLFKSIKLTVPFLPTAALSR